jgi:hypothetical protein
MASQMERVRKRTSKQTMSSFADEIEVKIDVSVHARFKCDLSLRVPPAHLGMMLDGMKMRLLRREWLKGRC